MDCSLFILFKDLFPSQQKLFLNPVTGCPSKHVMFVDGFQEVEYLVQVGFKQGCYGLPMMNFHVRQGHTQGICQPDCIASQVMSLTKWNPFTHQVVCQIRCQHAPIHFFDDDFRINGLYVDYQMKRENFGRASAILKDMLSGNERNFKVWEQILYAENALNHPDSVVKYGEAVIKIFEYETLPYLYTGIACQQLKNPDKAIKLFEKGIRLTENNNIRMQFYIYLAEAFNDIKEMNKSFEYYEKALSIDKYNKLVLNNYAYFLALSDKDLEKAEQMSKYTVADEKKNYVYLDTYGWILYKMNKESKAKRYIKRAWRYGGSKSSEVMDHYNTLMGK